MAYGLSNSNVTDDVTWPRRCCETIRSAILATAWLLVLTSLTASAKYFQYIGWTMHTAWQKGRLIHHICTHTSAASLCGNCWQYDSCRSWLLLCMICREFRKTLEYRPLTASDVIEHHQICVCLRKRPINKKGSLVEYLAVINCSETQASYRSCYMLKCKTRRLLKFIQHFIDYLSQWMVISPHW